jgi:hypothetical protein
VSDKSPTVPSRGGEPQQSLGGCFTRLAWSLGGLALVVMLWVTILRGSVWTLTVRDALYWAAVLGMIAARHIDVSRYLGSRITGEPATARDVRRYAAGVLAASSLAWCVAQSFDV